MDGLTLLQEARAAGLTVQADGARLRIRGPRRAEPIVQQLIAHKTIVLSALSAKRSPDAESLGVDEAVTLVASCYPAWDALGRDRHLSPLADAVDRAFLDNDLAKLRFAVSAFLERAAT
jgi:hypothetical protein